MPQEFFSGRSLHQDGGAGTAASELMQARQEDWQAQSESWPGWHAAAAAGAAAAAAAAAVAAGHASSGLPLTPEASVVATHAALHALHILPLFSRLEVQARGAAWHAALAEALLLCGQMHTKGSVSHVLLHLERLKRQRKAFNTKQQQGVPHPRKMLTSVVSVGHSSSDWVLQRGAEGRRRGTVSRLSKPARQATQRSRLAGLADRATRHCTTYRAPSVAACPAVVLMLVLLMLCVFSLSNRNRTCDTDKRSWAGSPTRCSLAGR